MVGLWIAGMTWLTADQDYTSGELLDHLMAWRQGERLYSDPQQLPYRVFNYPPLGMAVVRMFAAFGMTPLQAGRLVGTLGILVALWVIYGWMREMGVSRTLARATLALTGMSFPLLYAMGQFHLEGFAIASTLMGVRYVWRSARDTSQLGFVIGGILMAAAGFVKQTQVLSLMLVLCWLLVHKRQHFLAVAGPALVVGLTGAAVMQWLFGDETWRHIITYTVGTYSLGNLSFQLTSHLLPWLPLAVGAWYHTFRNDLARRQLATWYLAGVSLLLLTSARTGSGFQYFLEWQLVVLLLLAPALQQLTMSVRPIRRSHVVGIATLMLMLNAGTASFLVYNWQSARNTELAFEKLCALAPKAPALTPTENPGAARACGARPALHPFIIANLTARGLWDELAFVEDVTAGRYPALLLPFNPGGVVDRVQHERWSPAVLRAMRETYHPLQTDRGWWLLVPVRGTPANSVAR